jgi:aryl-alcohol dehydrogenase-like predicted oxidoreductase
MQSRRQFLSTAAQAALAAALAQKSNGSPDDDKGEWRNRQPGVSYRRLGRTGFQISEVVMGGNTIAPDNFEHVLAALDRGLNYLDTAPAYGNGKSEAGYAKVIKARDRDKFFLNSKISLWDINRNSLYQNIFDGLPGAEQDKFRTRAADFIEESQASKPEYFVGYFEGQRAELESAALANVMEREYGRQIDRGKNYKQLILKSVDDSMARLGTDHLDLMMCPHGANTPFELKNFPEIFEAFEIVKKAGKVRHLGVSAHTDPAGILDAAVDSKIYSVAMVAYNIVNHQRVDAALARAKKNDLGVIAMKVARPVNPGRTAADPARVKLMQDAIPGPLKVPQKAYIWALKNPNVTAVISELINQQMVDDNLPLAGSKKS